MSIVIPRSVWEPRYANGFAVIGTGDWLAAGKEIWLHHSVTDPPGPDATLEEDCEHMREFEQIGQSRFGGGISYTWVIMPSGRVFEGHSIDRQGSHTYQRNDRSRAICLAGRYHVNALPNRMVNSAAVLLRELGATIDGPHSAVYPTDCPGNYARARLGEINQLALSGGSVEDDDMPTAKEVVDELMTRELWFRVPDANDPRGYNETKESVANILVALYAHMFWGLIVGSDAPWGPGVARQLATLVSRATADVNEEELAAELAERGVGGATPQEVRDSLRSVLREGVDGA